MTPKDLYFALLSIAVLCIRALFWLKIFEAISPRFHKLDRKVKKATEKLFRTGKINLIQLSRTIDKSFAIGKIDGIEREYLYQRLKAIKRMMGIEEETTTPEYITSTPPDEA